MTKDTEPVGSQKVAAPFRLHDSMEFYKQKGITSSPPKVAPQTLLVGEEDEDAFAAEEAPIQTTDGFFEEPDDEEGGIQLMGHEEDSGDVECCEFVPGEPSDDDDDIIFADSDSEEEKAAPEVVSTPFWFGNEERDQLRFINEFYAVALNLEEEKKRLVRQPEPFVGKVERAKVDNGGVFTTLDSVEVYRKSLLPPGSVMPFVKRAHFLTEWSVEDGVPVHFSLLHTEGMKTMWRKRVIKTEEPSILFCLPKYGTSGYEFSVSSQNAEVTHSPSSLQTTEQRWWYDKYIPEELRHPGGSEEDPGRLDG